MVNTNPDYKIIFNHLFKLYKLDLSDVFKKNGERVRRRLEANLGTDKNTLRVYLEPNHVDRVMNLVFMFQYQGRENISSVLVDIFFKVYSSEQLEMLIVNSVIQITKENEEIITPEEIPAKGGEA